MSIFVTVTLISIVFTIFVFGYPSDDEDEVKYQDFESYVAKDLNNLSSVGCERFMQKLCGQENPTALDCAKGAILYYINNKKHYQQPYDKNKFQSPFGTELSVFQIPYSVKRYFSYVLLKRFTVIGLQTEKVFCDNTATSMVQADLKSKTKTEESALAKKCLDDLDDFSKIKDMNLKTDLPNLIHYAVNQRNLQYYYNNTFAQKFMEHIANSIRLSGDPNDKNPIRYCSKLTRFT